MSMSSLASCTSNGTSSSTYLGTSNPPPLAKEVVAYDKCPRCKVQFDFLKRANATKVPLILNCQHTVCEDCIRRLFLSNNAACPICKEKFTVLRSQLDSLTEIFQPHFTLMGQLVWNKNSQSKKNLGWVSTGVTLGNRQISCGDTLDSSFDTDGRSEEGSDDDYDKSNVSFFFNQCLEHTDQYTNIHCEDCNNSYCCYCFLENHGGHRKTYLYKLSDAETSELEKLKGEVECVLAQLFKSKKKVSELKTFDTSNVDLDIKSYFVQLHAKLHLAERNIRKRLTSVEFNQADLEGVNDTLKTGIRRVSQVLQHFKLVNSKQLNVRALYGEAQEIKDIPCRLVSDQNSLRPIELETDDTFDNIERMISVKTLPPMQYNVLPVDDWSKTEDTVELENVRRQSLSIEPTEKITEEARIQITSAIRRVENETRKNNEGKIRVIVTHINNLNSFYIQKYHALENLKDMNAYIGRRSKRRTNVDEFKIGQVYGVSYATKNSQYWRRGKLQDIIKRGNDRLYQVFFIDYGNTQTVSRDKIKEIDMRTASRASFAYECKLTNPDEMTFDVNAHLHLPQIIGDKELYLRFINKHADRQNVHEVDLLVAASNGGYISVRDLLQKTTTSVIEIKEDFSVASVMKLFKNSRTFSVGQQENVIISYIKDPHYICVQLVQNVRILEKMREDMEKYYRNKPSLSCIPVVNTDVVVKCDDESRGSWHRARITSVFVSEKEVEAYLVDWGKTVVVTWSNLRALTENFIKMECQGIILRLAHVEKLNLDEPWSEKAINFLREQIGIDETCRILVSSVEPLEVALFQNRPAADICVNSVLVDRNLAVSTGDISQTVYWPNMSDQNEEPDDDLAFQMMKKSEEILIADEEDMHFRSGLRLPVEVVHFQSPDLIYIRLNKYKEFDEERQRDLQIHYSAIKGLKNSAKSWKVGDECVVHDSMSKQYFRGLIRSETGNDCMVYLQDYAREMKVSKKKLYPMEPYFRRFRCNVIKCRLSNIKPAGDAGKWSQLAIEMLQKVFSTYRSIYIKKMEMNQENRLLGVMMWYSLTTPAKALEPSRVKLVSINQSLIEGGVAFSAPAGLNGLCKLNDEKSDSDKPVDEDEGRTSEEEKRPDWNELISQDEEEAEVAVVPESVQNGWPAPIKFTKKEFDAILTCVDNEGFISLRDKQVHELYLDLERNVSEKLNSLPRIVDDTAWQEDDMCTIVYDDKWYRGTVLQVLSKDEISVEMIDFGSEHKVTREELSRYIMFPDIPPLVNRLRLYDVYSKKGELSSEDVDNLLEVVTERVKVVIKGSLDIDVPFAEIYTPNGLSINDMITQKCSHLIRHENKVVLGAPDERSDEEMFGITQVIGNPTPKLGNSYTLPKIPCGKQKMFVVGILKWEKSYNVVLSTREDYPTSEDFESLKEVLQKEHSKQPNLAIPEPNAACVCLHPQKDVWARAMIYNVDSLKYGFVLVFFVDYGNVEMVAVNSLKEIRTEWVKLPVYMQIAAINIELIQSDQAEFVLGELNNLRGQHVSVEVVSQSPLKVHLYKGNKLHYQKFIRCNIVKTL